MNFQTKKLDELFTGRLRKKKTGTEKKKEKQKRKEGKPEKRE